MLRIFDRGVVGIGGCESKCVLASFCNCRFSLYRFRQKFKLIYFILFLSYLQLQNSRGHSKYVHFTLTNRKERQETPESGKPTNLQLKSHNLFLTQQSKVEQNLFCQFLHTIPNRFFSLTIYIYMCVCIVCMYVLYMYISD